MSDLTNTRDDCPRISCFLWNYDWIYFIYDLVWICIQWRWRKGSVYKVIYYWNCLMNYSRTCIYFALGCLVVSAGMFSGCTSSLSNITAVSFWPFSFSLWMEYTASIDRLVQNKSISWLILQSYTVPTNTWFEKNLIITQNTIPRSENVSIESMIIPQIKKTFPDVVVDSFAVLSPLECLAVPFTQYAVSRLSFSVTDKNADNRTLYIVQTYIVWQWANGGVGETDTVYIISTVSDSSEDISRMKGMLGSVSCATE